MSPEHDASEVFQQVYIDGASCTGSMCAVFGAATGNLRVSNTPNKNTISEILDKSLQLMTTYPSTSK